MYKTCRLHITRLLTDNGKGFTDGLFTHGDGGAPTGQYEFGQLCAALRIEHRLTRPRRPQTNGMVERFNGRISDVLKTHRFNSAQDLEQTLLRYATVYNHRVPQSALKSKRSIEAMKLWH